MHLLGHATRIGGMEAAAIAIASAQAARGDRVAILHVDAGGTAPVGTTLHHTPDAAALRRVLDDVEPDVVHIHGIPLPRGSTRALQGRPVVRALHDYSFGCASGERWLRDGQSCGRAHGAGCLDGILRRGCAHRADLREPLRRYRELSAELPFLRQESATIVHSQAVRDSVVANGFAPARVHVIPYFVSRDDAPAPFERQRTFAFVGRIVGAKGLDIALRALALADGAWDELEVVGDGWARPACERLATALGIADRVRFRGWLAPHDVARVMRSSRAVLLPSRWPEPFGIAGLEAFGVGRPVIGSRIGGIPEWLEDGASGILVPAGDAVALAAALELLAGDDALAARLGRRGWEQAAHYSAAKHLTALDAVYRRVCGAGRLAA